MINQLMNKIFVKIVELSNWNVMNVKNNAEVFFLYSYHFHWSIQMKVYHFLHFSFVLGIECVLMTKVFIDLEAFEFESRKKLSTFFRIIQKKRKCCFWGWWWNPGKLLCIAFCKNSWHLFLKCFRKKLRHGFLTLC